MWADQREALRSQAVEIDDLHALHRDILMSPGMFVFIEQNTR
jgi:hypothetical protein